MFENLKDPYHATLLPFSDQFRSFPGRSGIGPVKMRRANTRPSSIAGGAEGERRHGGDDRMFEDYKLADPRRSIRRRIFR